jgi:hypothetical protein
MSRNMLQNQNSVAQLHVGNPAAMLNCADAAHPVSPVQHPYLGRRPWEPRSRGKDAESFGTCEPCSVFGGGPGRLTSSIRRRLRLQDASVFMPAQPRSAGDPPAAIWAALVLSRALGS